MEKHMSRKVLSVVLGLSLSVWCAPAAWADQAASGEPGAQTQSVVSSDQALSSDSGEDSASLIEGSVDESPAMPGSASAAESVVPSAAEGASATDAQGKAEADAAADNLADQLAHPEKIIPDGAYNITFSRNPSFTLDVSGASCETGANVQLWEKNGSAAQRWYFQSDEEGYYTITAYCSGLVLDAADGGCEPGTNVRQCTAFQNDAQKWILVKNDDGTMSIYSKRSKLALDVSWAIAENGTNVSTWTPNASASQKFTIDSDPAVLPDGIYSVKAFADQSKMVDVAGGSRAADANVHLWSWNGTLAQKWKVTCDNEGYCTFESLRSGKMLTADGRTVGSNVIQAEKDLSSSDYSDEQKWQIAPNSVGGFSLISKSSGLALDLSCASTQDGTNVQVWKQNGTSAQSFLFKQVSAQVADGYYTIDFSMCDSMKLDVANASRENGANVQLFVGNGTRAQVVRVVSNGDGTCTIGFPFSRKVLDVRGAASVDGTNIQQWVSNGTAAQKWIIEYAGSGALRIKSVLGDFAIEVAGNSAVNGANIQLGAVATGGVEQLFTLTPTTYVPDDFSDLLAHFSTVSTNTFNGWYNMSRALSNFDGMVVWPGETVSFFDTCGPCGAAEGYLIAGVVGGSGYGGGICQASTTLYGAVVRAGLTIVERQNHTTPSTYVPIGQDAMVNWGSSDFRFRNDWDFPVKIVVDNYDRTLNCDIWGIQPDWYDYIDVSSWWTGSHSAAAQREYYKDGVIVATSALPNSWYW